MISSVTLISKVGGGDDGGGCCYFHGYQGRESWGHLAASDRQCGGVLLINKLP